MCKLLAVFALLGTLSTCSALTEIQINELLELNSMFDIVHKNYDNQIHLAWNIQKHNRNMLLTQFLSRFGFTLQEMKDKEAEVYDAIEARETEIGNPDSPCIESIRNQFTLTLESTGFDSMDTFRQIIRHFENVSDSTFYNVVELLHAESNAIQLEVLDVMTTKNPVSDIDRLLQKLREDYYIVVMFYENAIESLASEIRYFNAEFNQIRIRVFMKFEEDKNFFMNMADFIMSMLSVCMV